MQKFKTFCRRFLLNALLCVMMGLTPPSLKAAPAPEPKRPNIIVILCDDMGYSDIGCYGGEIRTPNLDKLASNGVRFTQFYNTARCCPTRASLLTGLSPHQAGVGHMVDQNHGLEGYVGDLNNNCLTIAQVLRPAGYDTYAVGKWHVAKAAVPQGPKNNWPLQRGFNHYYGTITGAGSYFDPGTLTRDNTMISPFADPEYKPKKFYYTDAITDHAIRFINDHDQQHPDQPLFMYVAFTAAHWPMHALPEDIAKYKGVYDQGYGPIRQHRFERMKELGLVDSRWEMSQQFGNWDAVENKAWETRCMEVYAAMIDRMDQGVGRIIEKLRQDKQLDNTLILYLQDNGACQENVGRQAPPNRDMNAKLAPIPQDAVRIEVIPKQNRAGVPTRMGTKFMPGTEDTYIAYGEAWANVSNTPFRYYKHFIHEGGISTPLIAHWPAGIQRHGELEKQPGQLMDIMATCVDLAGAQYPKDVNGQPITPMQGKSLAPAFKGEKIERDALYWEHEGNRAIRIGDWKLVAKAPDGPWELYNIPADRTEQHDLAAAEPERVKAMAAQWQAWAKRAHVLPWPWDPQYGEKAKPGARRKGKGNNGAIAGKVGHFELKAGDALTGAAAPAVDNRGMRIEARFEGSARNGVIVAQGGSMLGYTLFMDRGTLVFAVRNRGELKTISTKLDARPGMVDVAVTLSKNGMATLSIAGKPVVTGEKLQPLGSQPIEGVQAGSDTGNTVGDYDGPNALDGRIEKVSIDIEK